MEFNPNNNIVKHCLQGLGLEEKGEIEKAGSVFIKAWEEAASEPEKFIAAYFLSRHQKNTSGRLQWLDIALQLALKIDDDSVKDALGSLYMSIAKCYEDLNDAENAKKNYELANSAKHKPSDKGPFYHGTRRICRLVIYYRRGMVLITNLT